MVDRAYGSILFSPNGDSNRARKVQFDPNAIPTMHVGLMKEYPAGASEWLPKALPGEAGFGTYMKRDRSVPEASPLDLTYKPDTEIGYMTDAYFARMREVLSFVHAYGGYATYYDEVGYPSGSADHSIPSTLYRKAISRSEVAVQPDKYYEAPVPAEGLAALVAVEKESGQRVDLRPLVQGNALRWKVPAGSWTVMTFTIQTLKAGVSTLDYAAVSDYFDPEAVHWFIDHAYQPIADHLGPFLGNTIDMTYFDDVGIFAFEKTWSDRISARFKEATGRDPAIYYPALWSDIGPDTAAARVALFGARASLLGEGFPKLVTEWANSHGMQASGHCPGNYDLQPVGMNGDPFKFYRYTDVPMVDVVFGHGFGRSGYKLMTSAADEQDKPIVAAENFGAGGDAIGYRRMIELYVRGINRVVASPGPFGKQIGADADFANWNGRISFALQGGRHVADVAVLYPIQSLEAYYKFDAKGNDKTMPGGDYISSDMDYQAVGEMLLDGLHRDFDFVHPDTLVTAKYSVQNGRLELNNTVDRERYKVIVLPGGRVLSVHVLKRLDEFYESGGTIIATSLLPSQSAEFGQDVVVQALVMKIFGVDSTKPMPDAPASMTNRRGGRAVFLRTPSPEALDAALTAAKISPDVNFANNPTPTTGNGVFSYIHKVRRGADVYFFGNSSDSPIQTTAQLRAGAEHLELWDPASGSIERIHDVRKVVRKGESYSEFKLELPALSGLIVVSKRN